MVFREPNTCNGVEIIRESIVTLQKRSPGKEKRTKRKKKNLIFIRKCQLINAEETIGLEN